jgi:hypothetical protein
MQRRRFWGKKTISVDTLSNHFCKDVLTFESSLRTLMEKNLIQSSSLNGGVSLNVRNKSEIEQYL